MSNNWLINGINGSINGSTNGINGFSTATNGSINANTEIIEEKNVYPFGLQHKGYNNTVISEHPYGFNGKELDESLSLNVIEMDWRQYNPYP